MSLYLSVKDLFFPFFANGAVPSCHIRGRMIPFKEFLPRLKNYCLSLGFIKPTVETLQSPTAQAVMPKNDSIILLSTRVPYEPSWGVYEGLPRPLIHERTEHHPEGTTSNYIAPYLQQYRFAQQHIHLVGKEDDLCRITLPQDFVTSGKEHDGMKLRILREKIVDLDGDGYFSPLSTSDTSITYRISEQFRQLLKEKGFTWLSGRGRRIGTFLTEDLFEFAKGKNEKTSQSAFVETLLPVMNHIVTNENPQLQAALFHLQNEFSRTVDALQSTDRQQDSLNLLCIAGLDIDVAAFKGRGQRYFVPWAAFCQQGRKQQVDARQLKQDDLFVALMAQKKQCLV
jgi:hypothetical protein